MTARILPNYTYEDYEKWQGEWQLIDGVPFAMAPSPVKGHQKLGYLIARAFDDALDECDECEVYYEIDYKVNDKTVLRPDVVVVCGDESERYVSVAPKIVAEVVSPSTAHLDEGVKKEIYEEEGVEYFLLLYPEDLVAKIYKNSADGFKKVGDFAKGVWRFEVEGCEGEVDFSALFARMRRRARGQASRR